MIRGVFLCDKKSDHCSEPQHKEAARDAFFSSSCLILGSYLCHVCLYRSVCVCTLKEQQRVGFSGLVGVPVQLLLRWTVVQKSRRVKVLLK